MRSMALVVLGMMAIGQSCLAAGNGANEKLIFKERFAAELAKMAPRMLAAQDKATGRFGTGIWMVNDQHPIFPLAVAWATESDDNPYYHDPEVLQAIIAGGDALIEDQAVDGQWLFRKKDGSTWGMTYMPWTYSRWIRAFALVRNAMPFEKRQRWEQALKLGFTGIARTQLTRPVNIPAHHAMGLYIAGQVFDNIEWREKAKDFMAKVVAAQDPGGFWSEHHGPVVVYNYVYSESLGVYYAASGDRSVLPALERAAAFHSAFVYPNGTNVETIDERNPYGKGISSGNVGFSFTQQGRGYLQHQWKKIKAFSPDYMAEFILYGQEGDITLTASDRKDFLFVSGDDKSLIRRKAPWFICVSAYNCPVFESRWIQDRQNFVSVYHDRAGLIMGGGNTKMQPLWSNFTVGDTSLLQKKAGDANPVFTPPAGLTHVPSNAVLQKSDPVGLTLDYDNEQCDITVEPVDDDAAVIRLKSTSNGKLPVAAHIAMIPTMGKALTTEHFTQTLGDESFELSGQTLGGWIEHANWRLTVPNTAIVKWPTLPHNPYTKDGFAKTNEGRIVISLPISKENPEYSLTLTVKQPQPTAADDIKKEKNMIWANLLHLGYNMWNDRETPEIDKPNPDTTGCPKMRFDKALWDDLVQKMADSGVNMVVIDLGEGVKYKSHPEIAAEGAWSIKELKEELAKLRKLGIEPIPKLNFSATHDLWMGPYSRMVSTQKYYEVCADLIKECIEIFDRPRLFHLGMDEETYGHQRLMKYIVIRQYDLWWHDFNFLVEHVERYGSRAWIWSDYMWNHRDEFVEKMSKDVLQSNWYYNASMEPENPASQNYMECFKVLDANGFDQVPTGSNYYTPVNFVELVKWCKSNVSADKLKGFMQTPWKPTTEQHRQHHIEAIDKIAEARREFER